MSITITLEATRFHCPNCDELVDFDDEPLLTRYQCSRCEAVSEERRCPDDNVFGAEVQVCPRCEELVEDDPDGLMVPVITCVCHDEEHEVYN